MWGGPVLAMAIDKHHLPARCFVHFIERQARGDEKLSLQDVPAQPCECNEVAWGEGAQMQQPKLHAPAGVDAGVHESAARR